MDSIIADAQFAIVPVWSIESKVSDGAFRVYVLLSQYADKEGASFPSLTTMAERLGCSRDKVKRAIGELRDADLVTVEPRFSDGRQTSNLYTVRRVQPQVGGVDLHRVGGANLHRAGGANLHREELDQKELDQKELVSGTAGAAVEQIVFSDDVIGLTRQFAILVKENGHTLPKAGSRAARQWLIQMDRLLRLGPAGEGGEPVPAEEVARVMRWALTESDFWPAVIRSVPSFREKWSVLAGQSKRTQTRRTDVGTEWSEAWAELGEKIRRVGRYGGRPQLPQLLDEYVNMLGGWGRACTSFDAGSSTQRAQFRDWYLSRDADLTPKQVAQ